MAIEAAALDRVSQTISAVVGASETAEVKPAAKVEVVETQDAAQEAAGGEEAPEVAQANPDVEKAKAAGWMDKEAWISAGKDPDEWTPAKVFNKNGELYDTIKTVKKELKETQMTARELAEHNKRVAKALEDQLRAQKLAERDAAIDVADKARVKQLDAELADIDKKLAAEPPIPQEASAWMSERPWLNDPKMRQVAAALHQEQLDAKDSRPLLELYAEVEDKVKTIFPHKFPKPEPKVETKPEVKRMSSVEAPGQRVTTVKREKGWSDIPDQFKEVGRKFERQGVMSKDEYAKQYWAINS